MIYVCYPNNKDAFSCGVIGFSLLDLKVIRQNALLILKQQGLTIAIHEVYDTPKRIRKYAWYTDEKIINSAPTKLFKTKKFIYENYERKGFELGTIQI